MKKYCMDIVALVSLLLIVGLVVWNHQSNQNVCVAAPLAVSADVAGQPPVIDTSVIDKVATPATGGSVGTPLEQPASGLQAPAVEPSGADKVTAPVTGGSVGTPLERPVSGLQAPATGAVSGALTSETQLNAPSSLTAPLEDKLDGVTEATPEEEGVLPGAAPATGDK